MKKRFSKNEKISRYFQDYFYGSLICFCSSDTSFRVDLEFYLGYNIGEIKNKRGANYGRKTECEWPRGRADTR